MKVRPRAFFFLSSLSTTMTSANPLQTQDGPRAPTHAARRPTQKQPSTACVTSLRGEPRPGRTPVSTHCSLDPLPTATGYIEQGHAKKPQVIPPRALYRATRQLRRAERQSVTRPPIFRPCVKCVTRLPCAFCKRTTRNQTTTTARLTHP